MKSRILPLIMLLCMAAAGHAAGITLKKNRFKIVNLAGDSKPIQRAIGSLQTDIEKVMEFRPAVATGSYTATETGEPSLVIINDAVSVPQGVPPLTGEEAHEVRADKKNNRIIIHGSDTRGTIFAIYTFTEQVLGVPPLWYYCQWQPVTHTSLTTAIDIRFASPQVRFRAWFPNDTDLLTPWRKLSRTNDEMWLETLLRLKLNTVELEATVTYPDYKMSDEAQMVNDMGIVLTSHHHVALNNSFTKWDEYWRQVRHREPPKPSVHDLDDLTDFWAYNVETVHRSGIENLWQVTFRGRGDQPFWAFFDDAPKSDAERGAVITQMMQIQVDLIKKITGEKNPYVRTTFYDEMSNFLAKGYIRPPKGENMIWTYVAARRDHYPNDDVVAFDPSSGVKLGYYMNLQFTSTGAHLAPAEGPWKMEFNYRYVNSKAPLLFAVVNAGNIREFVTEMSAYAKMMWSYADYDTDSWLNGFCAQYFGKPRNGRPPVCFSRHALCPRHRPDSRPLPPLQRQPVAGHRLRERQRAVLPHTGQQPGGHAHKEHGRHERAFRERGLTQRKALGTHREPPTRVLRLHHNRARRLHGPPQPFAIPFPARLQGAARHGHPARAHDRGTKPHGSGQGRTTFHTLRCFLRVVHQRPPLRPRPQDRRHEKDSGKNKAVTPSYIITINEYPQYANACKCATKGRSNSHGFQHMQHRSIKQPV